MDLFFVMSIAFVVFFVIAVIGMFTHMILFGTVFGMVVKRFAEAAEQQRALEAAQKPQPCVYCRTLLLAGMEICPGCGAKRPLVQG